MSKPNLAAGYRRVFVEEWPPYIGAVLVVSVIAALMASGLFWGIFGGLKLWGDWFNSLIGLGGLLGASGPSRNICRCIACR